MQLAQVVQEQGVGSYLDAWLDHASGRVRAKTWQGYECLIRLYAHLHLGELPLHELSPLHLQRLYSALLCRPGRPLSGGSVLNLHLVLTQALAQAVRWGYLTSNPASLAQPPRPRRAEPAWVDAAASERILRATAGTRLECPVAIAISTGMRRGEILALCWSDLDPDLSLARVPTIGWTSRRASSEASGSTSIRAYPSGRSKPVRVIAPWRAGRSAITAPGRSPTRFP